MLFQMLVLVLQSMVAFSTIFLLVKILQQPIRIFEISGYWSCHGEEKACYHVKEHKKLGQKLVSKVTLHFVWGNLWRKQTVLITCFTQLLITFMVRICFFLCQMSGPKKHLSDSSMRVVSKVLSITINSV